MSLFDKMHIINDNIMILNIKSCVSMLRYRSLVHIIDPFHIMHNNHNDNDNNDKILLQYQ